MATRRFTRDEWRLLTRVERRKQKARKPLPRRAPAHASFHQEFTCCSKPGCRLCGGTEFAHGPYWFATWWDRSKQRVLRAYVGRVLTPAQSQRVELQQSQSQQAELRAFFGLGSHASGEG